MRVAFIQKDPMPDPALMLLGASTMFRGHECEVFIPAAERDLGRSLRRFSPAAVVFMPTTGFHGWALEQARVIQRFTGGAPNLFTGAHSTDHPDIVREDGVDLVMVGDPETTLPEILFKIFKERALPGTSGTVALGDDGELLIGPERAFIDDLDALPLPDLEIYRRYAFVQKQTTLAFAVGRGVFENTHAGFRIGRKELHRRFRPARRHSVGEAIQRLNLMITQHGSVRRVAFKDDTLLTDRDWALAFLARYRDEIALPFSCVARPDLLDGSMVSALGDARCDLVRLGIESGDETLRSAALGVDVSDADVHSAVGRLRERGIDVHTISFLGLPGETLETATATLDVNLAIKPGHAFCILLAHEDGATIGPELERLQALLPIVTSAPWLRSVALAAISKPGDALYRTLFQLHHDVAFVTGQELKRTDVLRIVSSVWRGRSARPSRPITE
jgi:anaerobic magnesium-protoporphyrin IX monomethyl ester cyclase